MLSIPNMNYIRSFAAPTRANVQQARIIQYLRENGSASNEDVQELLSVKQTRAYAILKEMVKSRLIVKRSSARSETEYILTE